MAANFTPRRQPRKEREKLVVIMGATGSGKSRLSVDLASQFPSEIINSDKIQVYKGLDITTNKITMEERQGVPHHLMGFFDPEDGEFTPSNFRSIGHSVIADIASRSNLPIVAGGSNSFIYALLAERFHPEVDVFDGLNFNSVSSELRYSCCFLWVDVSFQVLSDYLRKRVDDMLDAGMFEELVHYFDSEPEALDDSVARIGLRKAIGVPELGSFYKRFRSPRPTCSDSDATRRSAYQEAVREIKDNTCLLAKRQIGKIQRLRDAGWDLRRLDATEAFRAAMQNNGGRRRAEIWESQVLEPSVKIVRCFLEEEE